MSYTRLFYWLVVADNAKIFFGAFAILGLIFGIICVIGRCVSYSDDTMVIDLKANRKWIMYTWTIGILFLSLWVFTPNKKDALLIVAGGGVLNFFSTDSSAKQIPHELSTFVVTQLKSMATDAKVELNINEQKQKVLEEAKNMTSEELINKLKSDTTFKNIITQ